MPSILLPESHLKLELSILGFSFTFIPCTLLITDIVHDFTNIDIIFIRSHGIVTAHVLISYAVT